MVARLNSNESKEAWGKSCKTHYQKMELSSFHPFVIAQIPPVVPKKPKLNQRVLINIKPKSEEHISVTQPRSANAPSLHGKRIPQMNLLKKVRISIILQHWTVTRSRTARPFKNLPTIYSVRHQFVETLLDSSRVRTSPEWTVNIEMTIVILEAGMKLTGKRC